MLTVPFWFKKYICFRMFFNYNLCYFCFVLKKLCANCFRLLSFKGIYEDGLQGQGTRKQKRTLSSLSLPSGDSWREESTLSLLTVSKDLFVVCGNPTA
jgi:hypothetical protein